jgi:hypothetical protein
MRPESENRDWRAVHVGFENDGLTLDGLDVWTQRWRPAAGAPPVRLAHPAHPTQFHDFGIHEIGEVARPVRFAACELSNGVWGFYVPAGNPVVASVGVRLEGTQITRHESPDHTVRVDLAAVEWSNSHWVESPRVTDLATGRVVLDLWNTDWDATVSFPRDRCVRLGFRRYRHAGALAVEIDLVRESYRVLFPSSDPPALPEAPLGAALC